MPVSKYFKGHGNEVMDAMKKEYGGDKGESVFYATANKKGMTASSDKKKKKRPMMHSNPSAMSRS